ncbi:MAG: hypothetical protein OER80_03385 [Gammaproteobacteria bacterium]|nr:hypothetical protein [Gammaproteobacteria bacterium]MDH3767264.1 hypothetical protein [Gammaproteobacteria bacterium]
MPSITEKKRIIAAFLARCNVYAADRISHYRKELDTAGQMDAMAIQDKIGHWTAYRAFNEYTIGELDGTELDDWFEN